MGARAWSTHLGYVAATLATCAVTVWLAAGVADARRKRPAPAPAPPAANLPDVLAQRLAAVTRTEKLTLDKLGKRTAEVRRRVRSLYKLLRAGPAPLWVEPAQRPLTLRRRAAARRILRRDFRELALLRSELATVQTARERLKHDRRVLAQVRWPAHRSLRSPIAGRIDVAARFGEYQQRIDLEGDDRAAARLSLTRRGIRLRVDAGRTVSAVAAGRVRYAGTIRGLGEAIVIDHGGYLSVLGPITALRAKRLQQVVPGTPLGLTHGRQLYMEVRLPVGAGGLPIDPEPLLRRQ